ELGIPFSDPTADGPIIQASSQQAIRGGTTLSAILTMMERVRESADLPVVLFSYYNPLFALGPAEFARRAVTAGIDGILVVDLPLEEARELRRFTDRAALDFITLVAPTTDRERMKRIVAGATGFVYAVTMTGVTGTRRPVMEEVRELVARVRERTSLPVAVGFGIGAADQVRGIAPFVDGIVVGSALVERLGTGEGDPVAAACHFTAQLKAAMLG
ncbi:MAG: tryptophan synthase subunit alpha, partial [Syntrophales bacterium]|nr:tryptophan synthase subunit alpha [Syntrophales bacterium]